MRDKVSNSKRESEKGRGETTFITFHGCYGMTPLYKKHIIQESDAVDDGEKVKKYIKIRQHRDSKTDSTFRRCIENVESPK